MKYDDFQYKLLSCERNRLAKEGKTLSPHRLKEFRRLQHKRRRERTGSITRRLDRLEKEVFKY